MRKGMLVCLTVLGVAAAPAAAQDGGLAADDPCGDNRPYAFVNGTYQELPSTERTPRYDLKRLVVTPGASAVTVRIETCAPIGAPDGLKGFRGAYATLADGCQLAIVADEAAQPGAARQARIVKTCFAQPDSDPESVPVPVGEEPDTRFDIPLPADALALDAGTLVITVAREGLTGEAAAALAAGATWSDVRAAAQESPTTMGGGFDTEGNSWSHLGPTGFDFLRSGADLRL